MISVYYNQGVIHYLKYTAFASFGGEMKTCCKRQS